ncbi:RNA-binding protein 45 [Diabrotica virgifera virgifera]|uniref:RRM domain-containing protein n=1 Tax=Diabrotica virgifera virgifera TaxID=50390 RepID=A0ABM5KIX4_DIAVI|nr:RNA-binding protein 45 [Diabrotica virgifera virgifera]XP_050510154.1 RNA-binding protein 45 [Diabrotica virgifera virgifera]
MSDRRNADEDDAPYSRLFVVGARDLREDDIKNAFNKFGDVKDVWAVKDRNSGDYRGIFYVKYYKTSHAALALEEMRGTNLGGRPLKVMIAHNREAGQGQDFKPDIEEEDLKRLFIVVSKTADDNELHTHFKQFGPLAFASIVQDRETKQNKPFAYVKFHKFSDAAQAIEKCDKKYKAVFAKPRKSRAELESARPDPYRNIARPDFPSWPRNDRAPPPPLDVKEDGYFALGVIASYSVNQSQLWKLFDIVPSMDYCQVQYDENRGQSNKYEVVYKNEYWAEYALEKFHGFEYPPGERLIVKAIKSTEGGFSNGNRQKRSASSDFGNSYEIMRLAETIAQANSLIQEKTGMSADSGRLGLLPDPYESGSMCSKPLPPRQPMADKDAEVVARCFVVCIPHPRLNQAMLKDIFCRFGNLIDVYMLHHKNYGYAKYAKKQSAEKAIEVLNGIEMKGIRLSVVEAQERKQDKRQKLDLDSSIESVY